MNSTYKKLRQSCEAVLEQIRDDSIDTLLEDIIEVERTQYSSKTGWNTQNIIFIMATGGPHIEINTNTRTISGFWSSEDCCISFRGDRDIESKIDELLEFFKE
ncbi:hypothetical protein [Bacteroides sp.]|uniref:hypothetical protein n=1 Tax=Bacteroides sp. TaxID=29523 RepID=UPI0026213573|nr:hypothetical protein [Bacteroides sp.]MDD3039078.1 hypothetical protein [Bacteroides sp.]